MRILYLLLSGTRLRMHVSHLLPLLLFCTFLFRETAACTSRAMPKPRPEPMPSLAEPINGSTTPRPNVTFPPTFNCPPTYAAWYCLNQATCFTVQIGIGVIYSCECALGFVGQRCEYKELDGSYLPTRQRVMLEKASIVSGATLALLLMLICCMMLYIRHKRRHKIKFNDSSYVDSELGDGGGGDNGVGGAHENGGMDEIDGMTRVPQLRPFGPHHYPIKPLEHAFRP